MDVPLLPLQSQQSVGGVWAVIPTDVPKVLQSDRWHVWACLGTAELCWVGTDPVCAPSSWASWERCLGMGEVLLLLENGEKPKV